LAASGLRAAEDSNDPFGFGAETAATAIGVEGNPSNAQHSPGEGASPADAERRIERTLDVRLSGTLEFVDQPLNLALQQIADEFEIPIVFDNTALESIAVSPDQEVTVPPLSGITLRSALELILADLEVTYVIDDEVLLITSQDEAASRLEVRVYQVDDLVYGQGADGARVLDEDRFEALVDIIIAAVEQDSWERSGTGEGEIHRFPPGMLVVSQTRRVHDQIDRLLDDMREVKSAILAAWPDIAAVEQRPVTKGFVISAGDFTDSPESRSELRRAITRSVSWEVTGTELANDEVFLTVVPNHVLVRHTPGVVRQVQRLLDELGALPEEQSGARGGRGGGGRRGGF
jgi:hypothetical protein